jgi:hypothetical protein
MCGHPIKTTSNRQKYCGDCKLDVIKSKKPSYNKVSRDKSKQFALDYNLYHNTIKRYGYIFLSKHPILLETLILIQKLSRRSKYTTWSDEVKEGVRLDENEYKRDYYKKNKDIKPYFKNKVKLKKNKTKQ